MILKKLFGFDPSVMKVRTEIMAGVTTFLTMSYILAVNPDILSAASMDRGAVFTATALAASFGHVGDGYFGEITFCLGSGYGVERFFCLYVSAGYGIFLGECLGSRFYRGTSVYPVDRV